MKKIKLIALLLLIMFSLLVIGWRLTPRSVSCGQAVDSSYAQRVWNENQAAIQNVRALKKDGSFVDIRMDNTKCEGKAFLHIDYDTEETRRAIEAMLDDTPVRGLPIEWQNV